MEQTDNTNQTPTANDSRQIVADRCRSIMAQRGLKLADLASLCQLPPSNLSSMINGKRNPTLDTLDRLATALGIPTWQLLCTPGEAGAPEAAAGNIQNQEAEQEQQQQEQPADGAKDLPFNDDRDTQQEQPAGRTETPADAPDVADLITVDPRTGEAHRYRLIS